MEEKKDKDSKIKSQIGGQAVLEGVMMKGKTSMATAVRDEDGIIRIESKRLNIKTGWFYKLPIIRGVIAFVQSLVGGTKVLTRSAEVFGEGEPTKFEKWLSEKFKINIMSVITTLSMVIGVVLAVFLFMFLPQQFRIWIVGEDCNVFAKNFIEGGFKLVIFISYILLVSLLKDIRRVFMYHGAEHKTITCFEKGLPLTVENARACRRVHDRCGTTFIVFVMVISILVFALFESLVGIKLKAVLDTAWLYNVVRILCKLALLPIVAGLSYELLKGLSKTDSFIVYPLKVPGLLLQRITTREPNDDMLEVAITAFNTVMELDANPEMKTRDFTVAMKRSELLKKVKSELSEHGITEDAEAEWIIAITLNIKRSEVFSEALVSPKYIDEINKIVEDRITGKPLWYCIGNTDFMGYRINVDKSVLIPRPETELLVENAVKDINEKSRVLDLCTGSGAIAIAVKKKTNANVVAIDISKDAIEKAKENARINKADITFIESDLFEGLEDNVFDVIISNPPYIKTGDIDTLQKEVKDFEPKLALDGGEDGLIFYRRIAKDVKKYLSENGVIYFECGIGEAEEIKNIFSFSKNVEIIKDYEGIDRIVKVTV